MEQLFIGAMIVYLEGHLFDNCLGDEACVSQA